MRKSFWILAALVLCAAFTSPRAASAQSMSLASLAAASHVGTAVERTPGCWGCNFGFGIGICQGGTVPGYWNCTSTLTQTCGLSSPGCGAGAALPVDLDGATQYVSKGSLLGVPVDYQEGSPPVRRNCEGVVVARMQSPDDIQTVRMRTGSLSL